MKKPLLIGTTVVVIISFVGALLIWSYLDGLVVAGIRNFGPKITGTTVEVDSVKISASTGTGTIRGLVIGNPAPYQAPFAIRLGEGTLSVDPSSLTGPKVIIKSLRATAPEITLEGGLQENNLKQLLANIDRYTASEKSQPTAETGDQKKLQVDEFLLTDAKVNVKLGLPGADTTVTIPTIRLTNLGTGPEGITSAEMSKVIVNEVLKQVVPAVAAQLGNLSPGTVNAVKDALNQKTTDAINNATKGLDNLLKKK